MPDMMAIVSKAVFEKDARGKGIGDTWATDRYSSQNKALANLAGGDLYLVTVRPPNEALWLVAVLRQPTFDNTQWSARANSLPIRDISSLKRTLRFANGQGLPDKVGALGMSLQTPRVLAADDLALLGGQLAGASADSRVDDDGAGDAPAKSSRAKSSSARPSAKSSSTKSSRAGDASLAGALAQLRDGHPEAALEALVDAWADEPHPVLAQLIASLSTETRTPAPANLRGKTAAARAAWDEHASDASAADIPVLLESLCDVSSGDAAERLPTVEGWMPDPRVDAAFVAVLKEVPYRATSTKPFWTRLFASLEQLRDPSQLERIEAIDFAGVAATMAEWLRMKQRKLLASLHQDLPTEHESRPIFDELALAIGGQRAAGAADRESIEYLFQSVYENPHDDGPRTVLADALIERNDPRGELITVQLRLAQDPTNRALKAREKELLDAHAKGWLAELAPIVMADARFERGFLSECKIDNSKLDRVQKLVGHPAWSTVRAIEGSALIALDPVMRSLEKLVFSQSNARHHEKLPDAWRDLLVETPRGIRELQYEHMHSERQWLDTVEGRRQVDVSDQSEIDALCACTALPELVRLGLRDNPVLYIGKLVRAPVLERLEQLSFIYERNNRFDAQRTSPLVDFRQLLELARVPTLRFEIGSFHETELVLERGAKGYERARMTLGPTMRSNWSHQLVDEAIRMLDTLPKLRELRVTTRKCTETQQVARLRAAATQMNLDACEVS